MPKVKAKATLTVYKIVQATEDEKRYIANWLRKQANALLKEGHLYANRCINRCY